MPAVTRSDHPALKTLRDAVRARVDELGVSHWKLAERAGLYNQAMRYILEGRDSRFTSVADVLQALELELYVGPPRGQRSLTLSPEALKLATAFSRAAASQTSEEEALGEIVAIALAQLRAARGGFTKPA